MDDYIPKPIHPEKFLKVIEKWLVKTNGGMQADDIPCDLEPVNTVIDKTGLIDRLLGDKDLAHEILNEFMADVPHKFNTLKKALDNGDARLIQQEAHSLKGASANVGAMALEKTAYRIELAGKAEDLTKAGELILELTIQFEILKKSLNSDYRMRRH
jgi:HPt (histidine-containing phosphotransfer) domain-containing protein